MDVTRYLDVFEGFPVMVFDRDQYRLHGINITDDTNLIYAVGSSEVSLRRSYSFSSAQELDDWCVYVVNTKLIADLIPAMGRDAEARGSSYEVMVEFGFRKWLNVVKRFIENFGAEKVPDDIKGAMKDTEGNLGLPITFPESTYMGRYS